MAINCICTSLGEPTTKRRQVRAISSSYEEWFPIRKIEDFWIIQESGAWYILMAVISGTHKLIETLV
jgi:hypothetical protein